MGYVYNVVIAVYEPLKKFIPVNSATGLFMLFLLAILIVVKQNDSSAKIHASWGVHIKNANRGSAHI